MTIKIDIPGVGEVTVENAAQEDTMREILKAINKSDKTKAKDEDAAKRRAARENTESLNESTSALDDFYDSLGNTNRSTNQLNQSNTRTSTSANVLGKAFGSVGRATGEASKHLLNFGVSIAATAASASVAMIKGMDEAAKNPVLAGKKVIEMEIDAAHGLVDAFASILEGIPVIGKGLAAAVGGVGKALAAAAKAANEAMAAEYEKSVNNFKAFNSAGASFAGGMGEMDKLATNSGIGLESFSKVMGNPKTLDGIHRMGTGAADAGRKLSDGLHALTTTTGKSGQSLRNELFKLGVAYEDQGSVMMDYMASAKAAGKDLRNMTPEDVAQGTKEYAKNLKVLGDITGQNAQKLMQAAQVDSNRASLTGTLSEKQNEAFKGVHEVFSSVAPDLQEALTQYVATGAITNKAVLMNSDVLDSVRKAGDAIKSGTMDHAQAMQYASDATARMAKSQDNASAASDKAVVLGQGNSDLIARTNLRNALNNHKVGEGVAKKSADSAESQMNSADSLTNAYTSQTETMVKFQSQIETLARKDGILEKYGQFMIDQTQEVTKATTAAIDQIYKKLGIDSGLPEADRHAGPMLGGAMDAAGKAWDATKSAVSGVTDTIGSAVNKLLGKQDVKDNMKAFNEAMTKQGVTDPKMRAAMAAVAEGESGFQMHEEKGYGGSSNDRIRSIFKTKTKGMGEDELSAIKKDPKAFFNKMYGDQLGNKAGSDDGYNFRGRGMIQLTGRDNYAKYGKMAGFDLEKNPELMNDPKVASAVSVAYMKNRTKKVGEGGDVYEAVARGVGNAVGSTEIVKKKAYARNLASGQFGPNGEMPSTQTATPKPSSPSDDPALKAALKVLDDDKKKKASETAKIAVPENATVSTTPKEDEVVKSTATRNFEAMEAAFQQFGKTKYEMVDGDTETVRAMQADFFKKNPDAFGAANYQQPTVVPPETPKEEVKTAEIVGPEKPLSAVETAFKSSNDRMTEFVDMMNKKSAEKAAKQKEQHENAIKDAESVRKRLEDAAKEKKDKEAAEAAKKLEEENKKKSSDNYVAEPNAPKETELYHVVAAIKEMHKGVAEMHHGVTKHLKHGNSQRETIKKQNA